MNLSAESGFPFDSATIAHEYAAFVTRTLGRLGVARDDVPDLAQDVFLVVHRRLNEFEARSSVRTWLYSICLRRASEYRRRRPKPEFVRDLEEGIASETPEHLAGSFQAQRMLQTALAQLDEPRRIVFISHDLEERSMTEIAESLGCPVQTAYSRLHSARKSVRDALLAMRDKDRSEKLLGTSIPGLFALVRSILRSLIAAPAATIASASAGVVIITSLLVAEPKWVKPATVQRTTAQAERPPLFILAEPPILRAEPASSEQAPQQASSSMAAVSSPKPTETEASLLSRARMELYAHPQEALNICNQHRALFASGMLDQEREVIAIDALERTSRHTEAVSRARHFLAQYPNSTHAHRIRAIVGIPIESASP